MEYPANPSGEKNCLSVSYSLCLTPHCNGLIFLIVDIHPEVRREKYVDQSQ